MAAAALLCWYSLDAGTGGAGSPPPVWESRPGVAKSLTPIPAAASGSVKLGYPKLQRVLFKERHTRQTMSFIMKNLLIAKAHSAIMSSTPLIAEL